MTSKMIDMPELPDGMFWRVVREGNTVLVQLRKRTWYGSRWLDETNANSFLDPHVTAERLRGVAGMLLSRRREAQERDNMLGDYPPKK